MRFACRIPKAINTHSEYAIFISFPWKQWWQVRTSLLHYMWIVCLVFSWWHTKIKIENWNIQGTFKKMLYKMYAWVPHVKAVPINVCSQTLSFRGTASNFSQPQSCRFLSIGTLESVVYSSLIEHEETLYLLTLAPCQTFITAPRPMTGCDSLSLHMAMHALIQVEDAYGLICYSICNCVCFYPKSHTTTLYCLTCICFLSVCSVYFILDFIFILILQMNLL